MPHRLVQGFAALAFAITSLATAGARADQVLAAPQIDAEGYIRYPGGPLVGRRLGRDFTPAPNLPRVSAAVAGGVVSSATVDQRANILAAVAQVPASGGILELPCGPILVSSKLTIPNQNIILESGGQYCGTILAAAGFTTGDVLELTGNYSGVRDLGFKQQQTAAQLAAGANPTRTGGYTLKLLGAYQFAKGVSFQHCYRCVLMAPLAGWSRVEDSDMTGITPDAVAAGSGGITIWNPTYGPNNRIDNVLIYGGQGANSAALAPLFGINIVNSGATQISTFDVLGFKVPLLVNPGVDTSGFTRNPGGDPATQTSQALCVSNGYFDGTIGQAGALFLPSDSGYIFDSTMIGVWLTNTASVSSNGIEINTRASTRTDDLAFKGFTFDAGFIVNAGTGGNNGMLCTNGTARAKPSDITISTSVIAGWGQGVNIGCSDGTLANNRIGSYSPFGSKRTNVHAVYLNPGSDSWVISGNRLLGNLSAALKDMSSGLATRITDNIGYNGSQPATNITVGASPFTLLNGHDPATFYVNGGAVTSIVAPGGNVALASSSPSAISLGPNERVILQYRSVPTIARMPH